MNKEKISKGLKSLVFMFWNVYLKNKISLKITTTIPLSHTKNKYNNSLISSNIQATFTFILYCYT